MTLKVYLALDESGAVAALISDALSEEQDRALARVHRIEDADAVVSSTRHIDQLPDVLPERVGLFQLVDCDGGGRFGDAEGLQVANVAQELSERASIWAASQVRDAHGMMSTAGMCKPIRVGVIGIGTLGTRIVGALQAELSDAIEGIVVADIRTPKQGLLHELGIRRSTLDLLLSTSDVVLVAVHRGPTADPLLGSRELRLLSNDAWVVNMSGLGVVDGTGSLVRSKRLKLVERPAAVMARDLEVGRNEVAGAVMRNLRRFARGESVFGLVEHVNYPNAGDPAFWSSRMSPVQAQD